MTTRALHHFTTTPLPRTVRQAISTTRTQNTLPISTLLTMQVSLFLTPRKTAHSQANGVPLPPSTPLFIRQSRTLMQNQRLPIQTLFRMLSRASFPPTPTATETTPTTTISPLPTQTTLPTTASPKRQAGTMFSTGQQPRQPAAQPDTHTATSACAM